MDTDIMLIEKAVRNITLELLREANLQPHTILVLGCSSSEVCGERIGKASSAEVGEAVIRSILPVLLQSGIYLAVQCCEHLNRALIIEEAALERYHFQRVSVLPALKAGGACATAAYRQFAQPVVIEHVTAQAGIDIGDTSIGMHVAHVQVPVRPETRQVGKAHVSCLRSRPKFIGGERAIYHL